MGEPLKDIARWKIPAKSYCHKNHSRLSANVYHIAHKTKYCHNSKLVKLRKDDLKIDCVNIANNEINEDIHLFENMIHNTEFHVLKEKLVFTLLYFVLFIFPNRYR